MSEALLLAFRCAIGDALAYINRILFVVLLLPVIVVVVVLPPLLPRETAAAAAERFDVGCCRWGALRCVAAGGAPPRATKT